jgi:hypothetical protein
VKRTLKFLALFVIAVCSGTLALTLVRAERSESAGTKRAVSASSDRPPVTINQEGRAYRQDVAKVLKRHDSLVLDTQVVAEQVRQTGRLSIPTAAGTFDLTLAPHDLRAANYRAEVSLEGGEVRAIEQGPVRTYKGTVAGMKGAEARFTIDENTVEGLIITPSELYFVEPANRYSASASSTDFIAYTAADLLLTSFGECAVTMAEKVGNQAIRVESEVPKVSGPIAEELFSPARIVDLATEADFEYFTNFPSAAAANNEIISIMNQVEGIYNTQFGLQFTIVFQNVWATAGDPYTTADPGAALDQFRAYWNANRGSVARDLAHMWTGKDFNDPATPENDLTIGIAYRPGVDCPLGTFGYGMSERFSSSPAKFLLTAHEIGHNFNATHTDNPVRPGCSNTIMGSSLGSGTLQQFCPFSVNEIDTQANAKVACLSRQITPGCSYSLSPTSQSVGVSGGSGSVNVTTAGTNCAWGASTAVGWISITSGSSGTNNGTVSFAVAPNSAGFPRSAVIVVADRSFTVSQAGASACPVVPISYGQTLNRSLSPSDCDSTQPDRAGSLADQYSFSGAAGDQVRIDVTATGTPVVDTYLYLLGPNGTVMDENDDIVFPSNSNSRIPLSGFFTLPAAGSYVIEATSFDADEVGSYTLTLASNSPMVQFSAGTATATETLNATAKVDLTVTRTGSTTTAASVNYASSDGTASERSDYSAAVGTIHFQAGETTKTITVFIVDDSFGEASETFSVTLSNPVGGVISAPATVTVTINSNEGANGPNPVLDASFSSDLFVRQHYVDFFNREADPSGLAFWKNQIDECTDQACREIRRINVSAAFFLSGEFQQTGYLVYKANQAAFASGEQLQLRAFLSDTQEIGRGVVFGQPGADTLLEANKQRVFLDFVQRPAFLAPTAYPTTLTALEFVNKLNFNTIDSLSGPALTPAERDALVSQLSPDPTSPALRAQVLRTISENPTFTQRQFNRAVVLMQYYGYMRRNPNATPDINFDGFNFWLDKLNLFGGNFVDAEMVKAFLTSGEYIQRFGP